MCSCHTGPVHTSLRMVSEREGRDELRDPLVRSGHPFELVCRVRVQSLLRQQQHQRNTGADGDDNTNQWRVYWRTSARSFWPTNDTEYGEWVQLGRLEVNARTFALRRNIRHEYRDRVETSGWIGRVGVANGTVNNKMEDVVVLARLAISEAEFNDTGLYRCAFEVDGQLVYTDYMAEQ